MDSADSLRNAVTAIEPDPRMQHTLRDRHQVISDFKLVAEVPEEVRIHFETAKNLYLYAWFVYRFHMAAEQYVCSTLELALRERLVEVLVIARDAKRSPGLSKMLKLARNSGLVNNERFIGREKWVMHRAHERFSHEEMLRMIHEGLDEMEIDNSNVQPAEEDINFDWLEHFIQHLPDQRNMHAHGTDALYPAVLWTFEIVSEIINQIFTISTNHVGEVYKQLWEKSNE